MVSLDAGRSGSFRIGGALETNRLGFGALRITGPDFWGPPADRAEAMRTLRRLPQVGVTFIDTADAYGPDISEPLIREALHPYGNISVATKAGLTRIGPGRAGWAALGRPEYLRQQALKSLRSLDVEQLALWQLHRIDPKVPRDDQFGAIRALLDDGIIAHAGLSEVSVDDLRAASKVFRVSTVQSRYNLTDRTNEDVLEYCEHRGIGFIPFYPLAKGTLATTGSILAQVARAHDATPGQVALAWLLKRSPVMLPIPGTSKVAHLEENVAAANLELSDEEFAVLDESGRADTAQS